LAAAMMALGSAFQVKGLGARLWCSMKRLIASWSATSEGKVPRFRRRRVSLH
jgi:hypothetical protein